MCHWTTIALWILGSSINHLSSSRVVNGPILEAYRWLPQHPVTLQSAFSADEGHSHVAQGQEEEWTGVEAGWPLSLCSRGGLFPGDQTSSEWWEGRQAFNVI